jgi:outer membrane receptor protein involved in Fe transport
MYWKVISRKALVVAVVLAFLFGLQADIAGASKSESSPEYSLETIYVTGKSIQGDNELQKKLSISVKDKIDAGQVKSITDLLRDVAGFTVQFSPQSGTQITMRGVSNDRFLVAINGNIVENQGGLMRGRGLEWDMIPITNVQKIEIIRGASSAAYGGTWGGVVNIVTVQDPGENSTQTKVSYGSFNTRKYAITNQGSTDNGKFFWMINGNKETSDGFYRNNWDDSKDLNLNLSYKLQGNDKLTFAWTTINRKEGIIVGNNTTSTNGYDSSYPTVPDAPTYPSGPTGKPWIDGSYRYWRGNNYSLNYNTDTTKMSLYQNDQFRQEWVRTISIPTLSQSWESDLTNRGINWQQTLEKNQHKFTYGVQYQQMDYDLISSQSELNTDLTGVFLQDDWRLKNDVTVGLGLRYDHQKLDMQVYDSSLAQKPRTDANSQLSPKFSITKQLSDTEAIYASASSVFRPPTESDYYRWSGNYFNWSTSGNPYKVSSHLGITSLAQWQQTVGVLEPEHGMSYELGWKKQASPKFGWRVTGFYNDIDNYINKFSPSYVTSYPPTYNIGNAKIKGLEVSSDYSFNDQLASILTFTHQIGSKSGDPLDSSSTLSSIPQNTLNLGLRWQAGNEFRAALDTRYTGRQTVSGSVLGGYVITDLSFMLQHKDTTYTLAVCNIFDKQYKEYVDYPMPGTTYYLSCQTKL